MKTLAFLFLVAGLCARTCAGADFAKINPLAEKLYREGSFAKAAEAYSAMDLRKLKPDEQRWVVFRKADCSWRSMEERDADREELFVAEGTARTALEGLIASRERPESEDRVSAEAQESLGLLLAKLADAIPLVMTPETYGPDYLDKRDQRKKEAWSHIKSALDWWARSRDVEAARARYLSIVFEVLDGLSGLEELSEIDSALEAATRIASSEEDRTHAHLLMAKQLESRRDPNLIPRIRNEFEAAISVRSTNQTYSDALAEYAQWAEGSGKLTWSETGEAVQKPNPTKAIELARRLAAEFPAQSNIANRLILDIESPSLQLSSLKVFKPNSAADVDIHFKNLDSIEFTLRKVDLVKDFRGLPGGERGRPGFRFPTLADGFSADAGELTRNWAVDFSAKPKYEEHNETVSIPDKLGAGAYLILARGGTNVAREMILVSDLAVVTQWKENELCAYVCDAETGAPVAKADVRTWGSRLFGSPMLRGETKTETNGFALFRPPDPEESLTVIAEADGKPAVSMTRGRYFRRGTDSRRMTGLAVTDRSAYRPGEKVKWKVTARIVDEKGFNTPEGKILKYRAYNLGQMEEPIREGEVKLNVFGSGWGEFEITPDFSLGYYRLEFEYGGLRSDIADAEFSIEEYKLPEFKVTVETARDENGAPRLFRLGEQAEVKINAAYYFGAPVANAKVHVAVRTNNFAWAYRWADADSWFSENPEPWSYSQSGGYGATIAFEKDLQTDAEGNAAFTMETGSFGTNDMELNIVAAVRDLSRRQIYGWGRMRITRQRYTILAHAEHPLLRPGDKARINFKTVDANENGAPAAGKVIVTRETWKKGAYEKEPIATAAMNTDFKGAAEFTFTPEREGFYRVLWVNAESESDAPVKGETTIWVATSASSHLGYHPPGLEIIASDDSAEPGDKLSIALQTPAPDCYVILNIGPTRRELVHVAGTTRLIEIDIGEEHVPNFWIHAATVSGREFYQALKGVRVLPRKHFLEVEVKPDRAESRPGSEGSFLVTTRDYKGKPVEAEVQFGLVDESLFYIRQDASPDIRKVFFAERRLAEVVTTSSFDARTYRSGPIGKADRIAIDREARMSAAPEAAMATTVAASPMLPASEPLVRRQFQSTAFWQPDIKTDAAGTARITFRYPDSVTTWKGTARAGSVASDFGETKVSARTAQPVTIRLQGPRFFLVGDECTLSAIVNNTTKESIDGTTEIHAEGLKLKSTAQNSIHVPAGGESRVEWNVAVETAGLANIRVAVKSPSESDAMEKSYPIYEHGIEKFLNESGKFDARETVVRLNLPPHRKDSARLVVQVTPSLVVTMLDALPYLFEYPYGCTEQTMSRFLPAAVIAKTLRETGQDPDRAMSRAFNLPSQAVRKNSAGLGKLRDVIKTGTQTLANTQNGDGGWSWWRGGRSDAWITAYVVWGLALAGDEEKSSEFDRMLPGGVAFLVSHLADFANEPDMQAWILHALAAAPHDAAPPVVAKAVENVWDKRRGLSGYSRALFAVAFAELADDEEKAGILARNLENGVHRDANTGSPLLLPGGKNLPTAHWGSGSGSWRYWGESPVESTAFSMSALLKLDPESKLIEPAANWLFKNRRGAQWSNTRDTAIALLALTDYLKASGELKANGEFEIMVNGKRFATHSFSSENLFTEPSQFGIDSNSLRLGANEIRIRRSRGASPLYFAAQATFFSLEEPLQPAGSEIFVRREYYRLIPHPTLLNGNEYERVALKENDLMQSGEPLEVSILLESKNDYEYLVFEDLKPAGFEATALRSGEGAVARRVKKAAVARGGMLTESDYLEEPLWIYQELRDRKVASFIDHLPEGFWEIRYELRAETPGRFHALPVVGRAMYVPDIRCNSAETRVRVK